jgi:hypothetical protein
MEKPVITNYIEKDVWKSKLMQYTSCIVVDSGSDDLISFSIVETPELAIGVSYEQSSIYPKTLLLSDNSDLLIGADNSFLSISLSDKKINFKVELQSLLVDLKEISEKGILVIEEVAVSFYAVDGKRLWFVPTDFVETYLLDHCIITLMTESGVIKISLDTGEKIADRK